LSDPSAHLKLTYPRQVEMDRQLARCCQTSAIARSRHLRHAN
jgi:hypothetical protein